MGVDAGVPQLCMEEKWKLSKKEGGLKSCFSSSISSSISSSTSKYSSQRRKSFSSKCARLVKQQRARFYIIRQCVTMLICWQDCTDY